MTMDAVLEINNWRVWSISAVDENNQPFLFHSYAEDRAGAIADKEDELRGLRVTHAHVVRNG
jgi:hypothetical protein